MGRPGRRGFTVHSPEEFGGTLGQKLIRTVDRLRDQQTRFGMRPYVVKIVRVRWSGGDRNVGEPVIVKEDVILPTPKVTDLGGLRDVMEAIGREESGELQVSEISGRYSEGYLRGVDAEGDVIGPDESVYWLLEFTGQGRGGTIEKRFFQPSSVPAYKADRFEWVVTLMRAETTALGEVT